ncbi:hypothetical protein EV175_007066, partial [Coemansia sp. RSA 1933]
TWAATGRFAGEIDTGLVNVGERVQGKQKGGLNDGGHPKWIQRSVVFITSTPFLVEGLKRAKNIGCAGANVGQHGIAREDICRERLKVTVGQWRRVIDLAFLFGEGIDDAFTPLFAEDSVGVRLGVDRRHPTGDDLKIVVVNVVTPRDSQLMIHHLNTRKQFF